MLCAQAAGGQAAGLELSSSCCGSTEEEDLGWSLGTSQVLWQKTAGCDGREGPCGGHVERAAPGSAVGAVGTPRGALGCAPGLTCSFLR